MVGVIKYPSIERLCQEYGKKSLRVAILILVKDLCNSLNVVRNMNEDQMIEAACMLLDECGDFRLEDYVMMFSLAKRGQLVKIMDRIDIDTIGKMLDEYWKMRYEAGQREQERQMREYENKLKELEKEARAERNRIPQTDEEREKKKAEDAQQDEFFRKLKEIAKGLDSNSQDDKKQQYEKRDEMIKRHQETLRSQVKLRMENNLKEFSRFDETNNFPDGVINDMVFLLTAHNLDWKNLICRAMSVNLAKLESVINFKNKDEKLRSEFIGSGKELLGL